MPVDEVARGYPYKGVFGDVTPKNALTNDTVKLFLPWMKVVREELFAGRAALWNRYSYSGYPLLANGESAPMRRVNGAFIGFDVPAGRTQLRARYAPISFTISVVIAVIAFGALIAASWWRKPGGIARETSLRAVDSGLRSRK